MLCKIKLKLNLINDVTDSLKTAYSFKNKTKTEVDSTIYFFNKNGKYITARETTNKNGLSLQLQPYEGSFPLFLVERNNGVVRVTSDLYTFSNLLYDGLTVDIKLLGLRDKPSTVKIEYDTICSGDSYTFPNATKLVLKPRVIENGIEINGSGTWNWSSNNGFVASKRVVTIYLYLTGDIPYYIQI